MSILRLFKQYLNEPETEAEAKWQFIGFFQAIATFVTMFTPIFIAAPELKNATPLSPYWFAILLGVFAWLMFYWKTLAYWLRLSHNFGIMMHASYQASKKQKLEA